MILKNENTIVLCRRNNSCCPEVTRVETGIEIKDDYGNKVILTHDETSMLKDVLNSDFNEKTT